MQAFHGSESEKVAFVARLCADMAAGELDPSSWDTVQSTRASKTHRALFPIELAAYEAQFDIPYDVGCLEEAIYFGLWPHHTEWDHEHERARDWPLRFVSAIPAGADLSLVAWTLLHDLLSDTALTPALQDEAVAPFVARSVALLAKVNGGLGEREFVEACNIVEEAEAVAPSLMPDTRAVLNAAMQAANALSQALASEWDGETALVASSVSVVQSVEALTGARFEKAAFCARVADKLVALIEAAPRG